MYSARLLNLFNFFNKQVIKINGKQFPNLKAQAEQYIAVTTCVAALIVNAQTWKINVKI